MASQKLIATYYSEHVKGYASDVALFLGISWDEVKAALETMALSGKIVKRGNCYSLPGYFGLGRGVGAKKAKSSAQPMSAEAKQV